VPNASPGIPSIVFRTIHARTKLETGDALDSFKILISNVILTRWEQLNWIRTAEKTNICKFHIQLRIKPSSPDSQNAVLMLFLQYYAAYVCSLGCLSSDIFNDTICYNLLRPGKAFALRIG